MKRSKASTAQQPHKYNINAKSCRICLSNFSYRDIYNDYFYCGTLENYGQMLDKTFNIQTLKSKKTLICDECINTLRDATEFKQKILSSDKFLSGLVDDVAEIFDSDLDLDSDIGSNMDIKDHSVCKNNEKNTDTENNTIVLEQIKTEIKEETNNCEVPSEENCDEKDPFGDDNFDAEIKITLNGENNKNDKLINDIKSDMKKVKILKRIEGSLKTSKGYCKKKTKKREDISDCEEKGAKFTETIKKMQENTHNLIVNSNLCLFKSLRTKFACYDCKESFFDFKELRQHVLSHFDPKVLKSKCQRMTGLSYKNADISNLKCKLCSEKCFDLDILKSHLEGHGLKFTQNGHFLIPYKLEEGLKCVVCQESFNTFTRLSIHMNCHSTHNVCEICGNSYFNRMNLRAHIFNQHTEKKCTKCNMVFTKTADRAMHLKKVHGENKYKKRYCLRCNVTFKYTHQLLQHNVEKHGAEKTIVFCQNCGKKFASPVNLSIHIRSVHLKERNFACSVCEMRFFTKTDKNRHERVHLDDRSYSCSYCSTRFKTKDSLRRHLRRQHGHLINTENVKEKLVLHS